MKDQDNPLIPNPHPHLLNSIIKKPIIVPSSYQHKKTHKPRKAIRTTKISQSSRPINLVADETIYKEWEDRMERAATTAFSLDTEQDNSSGPRCHVTILGGADAQTWFETTSKQSNDPPLSRGYTLGSGEDSMKLLELMELCIKLSDLVSKKKREMLSPFWNEIEVNAGNLNLMLLALVTAARLLTTARHNLVLSVQVNATEEKPAKSDGFHEIINFLNANQIHYALTVNPTIYTSCIEQFWATAKVKTVNEERHIQALVYKKKVIITKTSIRSDLHLENADGTDCLPAATIFEELARIGRKQRKDFEVPHPSDSTADVLNEEHVPTHSNDPLEITNLKLRVKKLEKKAGLRTHKFKRLYKVGVTRRVESSDDKSLGAQKDASKQRRSIIKAINRYVEVTLVKTQRRNDENDDNLMFDTDVFDGDEIVVEIEEPVINAATTTKSIPVRKRLVQESSKNVSTATTMVSTATTTVVATPAITTPPQQRAKLIAFRESVESIKDQIELNEELAREIEAEEQAELERIQKERVAQEEASRAAIYEEWDNEQAMIEAYYKLAANL
ncbi:hypothetical protein Tco_0426003 [Tanacetum coccineum]